VATKENVMSELRSVESALQPSVHLNPNQLVNGSIRSPFTIAAVILMLAAGCGTDTTARRKQERLAAYSALPVRQQIAVDQGQLLHGMSTNAAYIAWGRPDEVIAEGPITTWIYREQESREHKHVTIYTTEHGGVVAEEVRVPYARNMVRAKITFENGALTSWSRSPSSSREQFQ
jgi:hypothetical protein